MKTKHEFWKSKPLKKISVRPNLKLPETKKLVRTALGAGIALGALGIGLAAFESATD